MKPISSLVIRTVLISTSLLSVALAAHSADLNGDGRVDGADLEVLRTSWRGSGSGDLNHDGIVSFADAGILFSSWGTIPPPPPPPPPSPGPENSADRIIFWSSWEECTSLTDAELDLWRSRGVGGFVCQARWLYGLGGQYNWTGDPNHDLEGLEFAAQRAFRDSNVVARARARGMKMYLNFWLVNYWNDQTPLVEWFNDSGWVEPIVRIGDLAGAARLLGFDGLALDQEMYGSFSGNEPTWSWDYPGRTQPEGVVRAKVRQRGEEVMRAIVQVFPDVEMIAYDTQLPDTFADSWYKTCCNIDDVYGANTHINFWDGMSSVEGYRQILLVNALFFKTSWLGTWDTALQEEYNRLFAMLSRRYPHWYRIWSRFLESPFIWIDPGPDPTDWDDAKPPAYVAEQLLAFRKWGQGRAFPNFSYQGIRGFDYTPYVPGLQAASTPAIVDSERPQIFITAPTSETTYVTTSSTVNLAGHATDNFAIQAVLWSNDRGGSGAAQMTWQVLGGSYETGWQWQMNWSAANLPLQPGLNNITVTTHDIKGNSQTRVLQVTRQ